MADLLQELITTADFPTPVCRALQGARLLVDAGDTAAAIDRMAVTLTAELQDQSPVVLGGSMFKLYPVFPKHVRGKS